MHGLGTAFRDLALHLLPELDPDRRSELHVRQRRAHVEARPTDHDRPAARGKQAVDLAARQIGEAPRAELLVDPDDPDQAMLEARLLGLGRRAGQDLEPTVDLKRVAAHRHRVLAALAQQLRDGDRDPGLPHRGRAEYRQDFEG